MKGFIFDLDGTLLDSIGLWLDIDIRYMQTHGIEYKREYSDIIKTLTFDECAHYFRTVLGVDRSEDEIKQDWREMSYDAYAHTLSLKPFAKEFVQQCAKQGRCIIATSCQKECALQALKRLDLLDYFENIVTTLDVGKNKEFPDVYLECAQQLNLQPQECIVFEDVVSAAKTARQAGFQIAGVYDKMWEEDQEEMKQYVDCFIYSFEELLDQKQ